MPNNKLPPELKRSNYIKVSINESELAQIELAKRNRKGATWIREAVLWAATQNLPAPQPVRRTPEPSALHVAIWTELSAIRAQVAGIGRNANQAAFKLNSHIRIDALPIFINIDRAVYDIRKQLLLMYQMLREGLDT